MGSEYTYINERLRDDEKEFLRGHFKRVVKSHELCGGDGIILDKTGVLPCRCRKVYNYVNQWVVSRLPQRYWFVSDGLCRYKEMAKLGIVKERDFSKFPIKDHNYLWLVSGKAGIGKTLFLANAVSRYGRGSFYVQARDMYDIKKHEDGILWDRMNRSDLVAVDDLHLVSGFLFSFVVSTIRDLFGAGKRVVVSSVDAETFGDALRVHSKNRYELLEVPIGVHVGSRPEDILERKA